MPAEVRWTEAALADLRGIWDYIAEDDHDTASSVLSRIREAAVLLAESPGLGRSGRVPNTRELILPRLPYFIAYRVVGDEVHILRVLHMKWECPQK